MCFVIIIFFVLRKSIVAGVFVLALFLLERPQAEIGLAYHIVVCLHFGGQVADVRDFLNKVFYFFFDSYVHGSEKTVLFDDKKMETSPQKMNCKDTFFFRQKR